MSLPWKEVNEADSQEVAGLIGLPRPRIGERRKWGCPFCGSSDSLHAYAGRGGGFGCWAACGAERPKGCCGYSNLDVARGHWGNRLPEACVELARLLKIEYTDDYAPAVRLAPAPRVEAPPRPPEPSAQERNLAALATIAGARLPSAVYAAILAHLDLAPRGRAYLRERRALDARAAEDYGFRSLDSPAAWGQFARHLRRTFSPAELLAAGFRLEHAGGAEEVTVPFGGKIPALVIPYWRAGEIVGLRFRNTYPDRAEFKHNRYRTLPDAKPLWPYNADAMKRSTLFVIEGEINAESLRQRGLHASGLYGAGVWLDFWTQEIAGALRIVSWYDWRDPKGAGRAGELKLRRELIHRFGAAWLARHYRTLVTDADANALQQQRALDRMLAEEPWNHAAEVEVRAA